MPGLIGDVISSRRPANVREGSAPSTPRSDSGLEPPAVLDIRRDEPVIDLRDGAVDLRPPPPSSLLLPPPPTRTDRTLTLVLNRVRYRLFGLRAVRAVGPHDQPHLELAALISGTDPPDVDDLVRQAVARRWLREGPREQASLAASAGGGTK